MDSDLAQFDGQNYLNLETFRKTGVGVKTPVWFVYEGGRFFVVTVTDTGKMKRIRHNPQARIAPCKADGEVTGRWIPVQAGIIQEPGEEERLNLLFNKKYGLLKTLYAFYNKIAKKKRSFIQIEPAQA